MSSDSPNSWTFGDVLEVLGDLVVEARGDRGTPLTGAAADSRRIQAGHCFVAVRGYREDGIRHWPAARDGGAAALVCQTLPEPLPARPFARVCDGYAAMGRVAELVRGRPAHDLELIGITGTNGKTTCAFLTDAILKASGRRTGMIGTVTYVIGDRQMEAERTTPMPFALQDLLAEMRRVGAEVVTVEVSSHSLAQRRIGTARFAAALFTNLSGDHLDYHNTMEEYFQAKRRLFAEDLRDGAPAVIRVDDDYGRRLYEELRAEGRVRADSFSMSGVDADFRMEDIRTTVEGGSGRLVHAASEGGHLRLQTPMIGGYNLCNVGCVAALGLALGLEPNIIRRCVSGFHGAPGRLQPVRAPGQPLVFVDYAHTDDALRNVLQALAAVKRARLSVVFGCGGDRDPSKRPRMARAAEGYADRIYVTSDNPRSENPESILDDICAGFGEGAPSARIADRREAIRRALADAAPDDIVVVAGKGHESYQEVDGVKRPFDDVNEVRKAFSA